MILFNDSDELTGASSPLDSIMSRKLIKFLLGREWKSLEGQER
jgi:hypothetical protein